MRDDELADMSNGCEHIEEHGIIADLLEEWNCDYVEDLCVAESILQQMKAKRVLEFGCGGGRCLKYLLERGYDVAGIDRSTYKIAKARDNFNDRLPLYCQDVRSTVKGKWDAVLMLGSFVTYWPRHETLETLWELARRALRTGGVVIFNWEEWCGGSNGGTVETPIRSCICHGKVVDSYDPVRSTNSVTYMLDLSNSAPVRFSFYRRLLCQEELLRSLIAEGFSRMSSTQLSRCDDQDSLITVREWVSVATAI